VSYQVITFLTSSLYEVSVLAVNASTKCAEMWPDTVLGRVACAAYLEQSCIGLALEQGQILQGLLVKGLLGSGGLIVHLSLQHDYEVRHVTGQDDICEPY